MGNRWQRRVTITNISLSFTDKAASGSTQGECGSPPSSSRVAHGGGCNALRRDARVASAEGHIPIRGWRSGYHRATQLQEARGELLSTL